MMFTLVEVKKILVEHYTPAELIDVLGVTTQDLVDGLDDIIEEKFDDLVEQIKEDIGYGYD